MELRHIRYFLAVAEELNFTRAAARIGIGQPPLSQQIRDLEDELGVQLFHRVPHGAALTDAGRAFLAEARGVLAGAERAKAAAQRAQRGEAGTLSLGFTGSAAFNPVVSTVIRTFRRRWPGVLLSLEEMNTMRLLDRLARGALDAAFIRPGVQDPEGVRLKRYPDEPMLIALPARHGLVSQKQLPLSALAAEPFVLFPRVVGLSLYDEVVSACRRCGFEPIAGQEAPQIAAVVNLVAAELGVSIVPASIAQIRLKGVAYRPIEGPAPVARLALACRQDARSVIVGNLFRLVPGV
ncbi:MAG: LysR family transcriptional regulator [Acetobacteraceae bacterium]